MRWTYLARLALVAISGCSSGVADVAPAADDTGGADATRDSGVTSDTSADVAPSDTTAFDGSGGDVTSDDVPAPPDAPSADSGGAACGSAGDPTCGGGFNCCAHQCKNFQNDPLNCGGCDKRCEGAASMCLRGSCAPPTCAPPCGEGTQCCLVQRAGPIGAPTCEPGITCPVGCPLCK